MIPAKLALTLVYISLTCVIAVPNESCKKGGAKTNMSVTQQQSYLPEDSSWGGEHISMTITKSGAELNYDCAHGSVGEPIKIAPDGSFSAKGTHVIEGPGPIRVGRAPNSHPALYTGHVDEKTMTLHVKLTDTNQEIGTFKLEQGREGRVFKCR
jgi:hypothetical protein